MSDNTILLELKRVAKEADYTIGKLYINGVYFCDTLEDAVRPAKIKHQTAISAGTYKITLERSPRFGKVLPLLHNVPEFTGILIHSGNTKEDTSGCILVGKNTIKGKITESTVTMNALMDILTKPKNLVCIIKIS